MLERSRYRFKGIEEVMVGRTTVVAYDRGDVQLISIGLIATIGPWTAPPPAQEIVFPDPPPDVAIPPRIG